MSKLSVSAAMANEVSLMMLSCSPVAFRTEANIILIHVRAFNDNIYLLPHVKKNGREEGNRALPSSDTEEQTVMESRPRKI